MPKFGTDALLKLGECEVSKQKTGIAFLFADGDENKFQNKYLIIISLNLILYRMRKEK